MGNKKKKPVYVSLGSISRNGNEFSVKHSVKGKNKGKIDRIRIQWKINGQNKDTTVDHGNLSKNNGADSITVKRGDYYPVGSHGNLWDVSARAIGRVWNSSKNKYVNKGGWSGWATFTTENPAKPTVTQTVDAEGNASYRVVTAHPATGKKACYNTRCLITHSGNVTEGTDVDYTSRNDDFTCSTDMSQYTSLEVGQYIKVKCETWAQGFRGATAGDVKEHVFARPYPPVITSATLSGNVTTGTVVVSFTLDEKGGNAPVDSVQLYRLKSGVATKEEAAVASGWSAVSGAEDDGQVAGLTDAAADAKPITAGTRVWYRIQAARDSLTNYSDPFECTDLYTSKSYTSTGTVTLSAEDAGDSWVEIGITDSDADDDCVRVSWANWEDAWTSTDQPDSFDVTWLDSGAATVYVKGLENGTRYWFRGQSVDEDADGHEILGALSEPVEAIPSSDFGTVTVTAPVNVGVGDDMGVSWAFSSDMEQAQAQVFVEGTVAATVYGTGTDATVPASMLEPYGGGSVDVTVSVVAGGSTFESDAVTVVVADSPTCTLSVSTLTAQPLSFTVTTDSPNSPTATVQVISNGATGSGLDGDSPQYEGDCVWSANVEPTWGGSGPYTATVTAPDGRTFWENGTYTVTTTLSDPVTGLVSEPASSEFAVAWAHQADAPTATATADASGLSVAVTVNAPVASEGSDGYVEGDRFDLYRVTVDGERRIARNQVFGTTIVDRFAPFSGETNARYLAVTRTADGDWAPSDDITYDLPCPSLRFDWDNGESLDLPYDIEDSAGFEKGYSEDTALDGEVIGWWDGSSRRKESLRTNLIRLKSAEEEEAVAAMAAHPGPVFVRTPAGAAFPANVVPSDVSRSYGTGKVSVALDCAEVALTEEHMPNASDITVPEWNGGAVTIVNGVVYDATGGFPMDDWTYCGTGYADSTVYVVDADGVVRDGGGTELADYTWDGLAVYDASSDTIPLTSWTLLGTSQASVTYLIDLYGVIRDSTGAEAVGYTWDGTTLYDGNGDPVELS